MDAMLDFLVNAKRRTYAAQGDDASVQPLLPGSRQLEYGLERFCYRDVYFGGAYFVGQETVYVDDVPRWAMGYAGGVVPELSAQDVIREVYAFLRTALREVTMQHVFRGPPVYGAGQYCYTCEARGEPANFHGDEAISRDGLIVYRLHFAGGTLR